MSLPREAWPLARVLSGCLRRWAVPGRWMSHALGRRQASLGTPVPRTPTAVLRLLAPAWRSPGLDRHGLCHWNLVRFALP